MLKPKAPTRLRFGALVRVSTEQQEEKGESLNTQRASTERDALRYGKIVAWYGGQEHATPGWEKGEVDRLLSDAQKGKFDAVIVAYADRWSRDNAKSADGLRILRENGVRFFVGATEYDLYNPEHELILGMNAVFGQFQARQTKKKSIENRIARAKRGVPTAGKLPFGRTYDATTGKWGVDKAKQRLVQSAAKRYLAGENLEKISTEFGLNHACFHKTLMHRTGSDWALHFDSDDLNIHETVPIKIPPLLDDETIKAIKARAATNRKFYAGAQTQQFLFSRVILCGHCGRALTGTKNRMGRRYYRHPNRTPCNHGGMRAHVFAEDLEPVVMRHLFETFGNPMAVAAAIDAAVPDKEKMVELRERNERLNEELAKTRAAKERIVDAIAGGTITQHDARRKLEALREREGQYLIELDTIAAQLEHLPHPAQVAAAAGQLAARFQGMARLRANIKHANTAFEEMDFEAQRQLVEEVFKGKTRDGKRMGIHVEWIEGQQARRRKRWKYTIVGDLINEGGIAPLKSVVLEEYFGTGAPTAQDRYALH